jgi:ferredoxin, 2Fe-2S
MTKITYLTERDAYPIDATNGITLMQLALTHGVPGIVGECGGVMSCATCHVYVDEAWYGKLPAPHSAEVEMLEFADEPTALSRLCCQIKVRDELDGLIVRVPKT